MNSWTTFDHEGLRGGGTLTKADNLFVQVYFKGNCKVKVKTTTKAYETSDTAMPGLSTNVFRS